MFTAYPQHIHTVFVYNYTTQYTDFAVYICFPFHNVIFFHNHCPIHSTTMFTAYTQHIHTVLFTITLPSRLTLLFIYASFTQCDIFSQLLHNWLSKNVYSISLAYKYSTIYNYTTQYTNCAVYIYFPFHNVNIFPRSLYNCLFHYVYSEASLDTYSTVYNYSPQYTVCAVYNAVLFTMWYFSSITAQLTLQQCLQHILNIYIRYCYNYTTQYTDFAVYICFPFHNVIFFHNYSTIDSTKMSIAYPQHIHTVLFTITIPSILYVLLHMLPFHNVIFFHNHCPIHSTTNFTAYNQHIHTVLFTITQPSILYVLFTYASFSQCDIFSQSLHNLLYNSIYSISSTYAYSTVCNYSLQYTRFAVYICCPFHNVIFFHNHCIIYSTTVLQHILNICIQYCLQFTTQ